MRLENLLPFCLSSVNVCVSNDDGHTVTQIQTVPKTDIQQTESLDTQELNWSAYNFCFFKVGKHVLKPTTFSKVERLNLRPCKFSVWK